MNPIDSVVQTSSLGFTGAANGVLGKDDFLRILVTQLQNQDPINPMKGEEFAVQLAQFSSVEQLQNINTNLENVMELDLNLNRAINNTLATTFIGRGVRALGNRVALTEGEPVTMHFELASASASTTIEVRNLAGNVVRTIELNGDTAGRHQYEWDGKDDAGKALPEGEYTFHVNALDGNGNNVPAQSMIVGTIDSIRYIDGNAILRLGALEVDLASVLEIGLNASAFGGTQTEE